MRRIAAIGALAASALLSGCVVAALPIAAGAVIGRNEIKKRRERPAEAFATVATPASAPTPLAAAAVTASRPPLAPGGVPAAAPVASSAGEAAAQSLQVFIALRNHLAATARLRDLDVEPDAVVLSPGASPGDPEFYACQAKPLAVVLDIDGTVLAGDAAVPGAAAAVEAARKAGVVVVFNADRSAADAGATQAALRRAGLGDAAPGSTLWLQADGDPPGKDARRLEIAKRYCVIAQVGNDLGDFSDLIARRGDAALSPQIAQLWGAGWFVLPTLPTTTTAAAPVEERR